MYVFDGSILLLEASYFISKLDDSFLILLVVSFMVTCWFSLAVLFDVGYPVPELVRIMLI